MRIGGPALLFAAVLALVAVGEQARRARIAARPEAESGLTGLRTHAAGAAVLSDVAAMDRELDRVLARMNSATGQAKLEAMAEAINVMARQHGELRQALEAMQERMTAAAGAQGDP